MGQPLDHEAGRPADHQLELLALGDRGQHADRPRAGDGGPPRRSRPLRAAGRVQAARAAGADRRRHRRRDRGAEGPAAVRAGGAPPPGRGARLRGKALDDSIETLRSAAGDNVRFTGWVSDEELEALYARASVYVQASRHEGFGLAVAEAMLAGCVPVVMNVTAMPEVVDGAGVLIDSQDPEAVASGIREALALGPDAHRRARERILSEFPMEIRREGILRVTGEALAARGIPSQAAV
ncbi:MAG: glycosyltransferase [Thermoleophilaceae bacterium]